MKNKEMIRRRYLSDDLPVRLGGIAANLARINSFSDNDGHMNVVESLLEESKYFIEWTIKDTTIETQEFLLKIQIQLALWQLHLVKIWNNNKERLALAAKAYDWSRDLLRIAGLV
jgi:hypothetical protein